MLPMLWLEKKKLGKDMQDYMSSPDMWRYWKPLKPQIFEIFRKTVKFLKKGPQNFLIAAGFILK